MTSPAPETLEREKDQLWVTDAQLIRRLGIPERLARAHIRQLDERRGNGWPKKQKLYGDRRYWPAVKAYFDRLHAATVDAPPNQRGRHDQ